MSDIEESNEHQFNRGAVGSAFIGIMEKVWLAKVNESRSRLDAKDTL